MRRRYNLTYFLLAIVVFLVLTPLMVVVDAQAQIAFASDRAGNWEIYVMDADRKIPRRLTDTPFSDDHSPAWSPDGKRIAFGSDRDGNGEIYVMDADGKNQRRLTKNLLHDTDPAWSPNGEHIAFMSDMNGRANYDIYVMDADGGNPQNLTNAPNDDREPSWSPDGERIAFSSRRAGHFSNNFGISYEIYVMNADGSNPQNLTNNRQNDWFPSWSPDGEQIAFAADRKADLANFDIYVMNADGGNPRNLTNNRDYDWEPAWSPDSKRIVFTFIAPETGGEIYVVDVDGDNLQKLTNNRHSDFSPAWVRPAFSVAPAGKKIAMWGWLKQGDR